MYSILAGECLGGALWWKDLLRLAEEVGFSAPRLVTASVITVDNKELQDVLGLKLLNVSMNSQTDFIYLFGYYIIFI